MNSKGEFQVLTPSPDEQSELLAISPTAPTCEHDKWIHQRVCNACGVIEEYTNDMTEEMR